MPRIIGFLLSFSFFLSACVTVPGTGKRAFDAVPRGEELKMGDDAFQDVLQKNHVSTDRRLNAIVERVGSRIAAKTPVDDFKWEFKLIDSKEMNAFCLPGGKVVVYSGILPALQDEGGLAIVLGHEITHAVDRHGAQRISQEMLIKFGLAVFDFSLFRDSKYRNVALAALGAGATVGLSLPFSRSEEAEADTLGIKFSAAAGYDPSEGPLFWQRFSKMTEGQGKPPALLSDHPADEWRIQNMQNLQPEVLAIYQKSPKYGFGEKL